MTSNLLLQSSAGDVLWAMITVVFYILLAAAWAGYGWYKNNRQRGEGFDVWKALPALLAGGFIGLGVVWSGQALNSEYVIAVSGFLIPLIDKVWTTVQQSYDTATEMHEEGESLQSIALEIAQIVDREVDQEDVTQVITEYERRFGKLDPSYENVQDRSEDFRDDYGSGGVEGAIEGAQQPSPKDPRADEPVPEVEDDGNEITPHKRSTQKDDSSDIVRDGP